MQRPAGRSGILPCLLAVLSIAGAVACSPAPRRARNLILVSVDTLRADRLGCYGYGRPTSPAIDGLAREGVLFERATSPSPWTLPAHASLFTGLYPRRNGVTGMRYSMPDDVQTLAGLLAGAGYATSAVVTSSLLAKNGLERGFERFEEADQGGPGPSAASARAIAWLAERDPEQPFFLLVHYIDPHSDYGTLEANRAPFVGPYNGAIQGKSEELYAVIEGRLELSPEDARHLSDLYDAAIHQLDGEIGKLVAYLGAQGLLDSTLLVLTSDHGEEFLDHGGVLHGMTQYEEMVHVPLIFHGPGVPRGRRVGVPVSLVDVVPTCLEHLGLPVPGGLDGLSLRSLFLSEGPFARRRLYYEADLDGSKAGRMVQGKDRAIRSGDFKLFYDDRTRETRLFDIREDPGETRDVSAEHPELVQELTADLEAFLAAGRDVPARTLTEEDLEHLRELGYAGEEVTR